MQQTAQELRMLSNSLFDCQSLTLNIKIRVSQFIGNSPLCQKWPYTAHRAVVRSVSSY